MKKILIGAISYLMTVEDRLTEEKEKRYSEYDGSLPQWVKNREDEIRLEIATIRRIIIGLREILDVTGNSTPRK